MSKHGKYPKYTYRLRKDHFGWFVAKLRVISPNGVKTWKHSFDITGRKARKSYGESVKALMEASNDFH